MLLVTDITTASENNVEAETYTGIYGLHKYWSKKPHDVVRRFITAYSHEGEIVLDPFCGSGVGIVEAIFTNRKAFGIDINPMATFITRQLLNNISPRDLQEAFDHLKEACQGEINQKYILKREGKSLIATHFLLNKGNIEEIWYKNGRIKVIDTPQASDIDLASSFSYEQIPFFYPRGKLFHNSRINAGPDLRVYQLFTPRNLSALATLRHHIEQIEPITAREMLEFCFTSSLGQASNMVFVVKRRGKMGGVSPECGKKEVGSWVIGFWMPPEHFEINVWHCFEHRFRKILKTKRDQSETTWQVIETNSFEHFTTSNANLYLETSSAKKILSQIPDNSIDYVITDPPHGDRIPYLELSQIWNEWLGFPVDFEGEIVVSDAKGRNKDLLTFEKALAEVFGQISRVLKPDCHFSLIFNSLDDEIWLFLLNSLNTLNFKLAAVDYFRYSANSVVQDCRKRGLKCDFILTFRKALNKNNPPITICSAQDLAYIMESELKGAIGNQNGDGKSVDFINAIMANALLQGKYCRISEIFKTLESFSAIPK